MTRQAGRKRSACFLLHPPDSHGTHFPMLTSTHRKWLLATVFLCAAGFAAWSWLRPYDWSPDPKAPYTIKAAQLKKDRSNAWLDLHLLSRKTGTAPSAIGKPVLRTTAHPAIIPAEIRLAGDELWLKFWLDAEDLQGPIQLHFGDSHLRVRTGTQPPALDDQQSRVFTTARW